MYQEIVDAIVTWSSKDIVLALISTCSVLVNLLAIWFYRKALNEAQNQNKIANSMALKESYKLIIESYSNTANPTEPSCLDLFLSFKDKQQASTQFRDWACKITLQSSIDDRILDFFKQYNTLVDIELLKGILNNNNLMPYHKVELITFYNDAFKITSINTNIQEVKSAITKNTDLYAIYHKHMICTQLQNDYKYTLGDNGIDLKIIKEIQASNKFNNISEPVSQ